MTDTTLTSSSTFHPKIQTENKEDILFIQQSLKDAIRSTLDLKKKTWNEENYSTNWHKRRDGESNLSGEKTQEDILKQIEDEAERWVEEMFQLAAPNIQINGLEYEEAFKTKEEFEPFDDALVQQAEDLHQEMTLNLIQFTSLRKQVLKQIQLLSESAEQRSQESRKTMLNGLNQLTGLNQQEKSVVDNQEFREFINQLNLQDVPQKLENMKSILSKTNENIVPIVKKLEKAQGLLDELGIEKLPVMMTKDEEMKNDSQTQEGPFTNKDNNRSQDKKENQENVFDPNLTPRTGRTGLLNQLKRN